jgi:hypothetical protein
MFRRGMLAFAAVALLGLGAAEAQVVVRVAPPRAMVERRIPTPGPGYVWTPGFQRWDGRAYVWQPGAWVMPPRRHARWVAPHWSHRRGGWVFTEGHWR